MDMMNIANISMIMSQQQAITDVGTAVLSKSLDTVQDAGAMMVKSLESLANPGTMGTVIDMTV